MRCSSESSKYSIHCKLEYDVSLGLTAVKSKVKSSLFVKGESC